MRLANSRMERVGSLARTLRIFADIATGIFPGARGTRRSCSSLLLLDLRFVLSDPIAVGLQGSVSVEISSLVGF
jgi:hypothetical protein